MKKLIFGLIATVLFSNFSFAQEKMEIGSSVTSEEYKSLDFDYQRLADYLTSAIASLKALEMNGKEYSNYVVDIHFSKDEKNQFKNSVILAQNDMATSTVSTTAKSCKVCGVRSAYSCLAAIQASNMADDFDVHVHNNGGGCVTLSW